MRWPGLAPRGWLVPVTLVVLAVVACSPTPSATPGLVEAASLGAPASGLSADDPSPGGVPAGSPVPEPAPPSADPASPGQSMSSPSAPAAGVPPTSPLVGVLTHIDTAGLDQVAGFTLRLDDGRQVTFVLGDLENPVEFPPGHLGEHIATSSPIRVFFRPQGADLVVHRLEDAE